MKNKTKNLIIFVDSLPYYWLDKMSGLSAYPCRTKVRPGLGYSINIHWELFGGAMPDEIGFFNEWTYDPVNAPLKNLSFAAPLLSRIKRENVLYRILRKLFYAALGRESGDVPPDKLCRFRRSGEDVFLRNYSIWSDNVRYRFPRAEKNLLNRRETLEIVLPSGRRKGERDRDVYAQAMKRLSTGKNLLVWFPDLDGVSHRFGIGSAEYQRHINDLGVWIEELKEKAMRQFGFDDILIFSDHGMSNVTSEINPNLEHNIGKACDKNYHYFLDSTMLRVWARNEKYIKLISEYLYDLNIGRILDDTLRKEKGLSSQRFGNLIFILNEGTIFNPVTIFSTRPGSTKAMHGYLPELESQKGVFLSLKRSYFDRNEVRTFDVFDLLQKKLI